MAQCELCGNDYDQRFEASCVAVAGVTGLRDRV